MYFQNSPKLNDFSFLFLSSNFVVFFFFFFFFQKIQDLYINILSAKCTGIFTNITVKSSAFVMSTPMTEHTHSSISPFLSSANNPLQYRQLSLPSPPCSSVALLLSSDIVVATFCFLDIILFCLKVVFFLLSYFTRMLSFVFKIQYHA